MKLKNVDNIKDHEQLRLKAYMPTPNDVPTIGWGHTKGVKMGMVITEAQAEQFLKEDLAWVDKAIERNVKVPLNQNQYDALGSWVFNLGEGNLQKSALLRKLNSGDYSGAANEFLKWNKQRDKKTGKMVVLNGLTTRRAKERELFLSPVKKVPSEALGGSLAGAGTVAATLAAGDFSWPVVALVGAVVGFILFMLLKGRKA